MRSVGQSTRSSGAAEWSLECWISSTTDQILGAAAAAQRTDTSATEAPAAAACWTGDVVTSVVRRSAAWSEVDRRRHVMLTGSSTSCDKAGVFVQSSCESPASCESSVTDAVTDAQQDERNGLTLLSWSSSETQQCRSALSHLLTCRLSRLVYVEVTSTIRLAVRRPFDCLSKVINVTWHNPLAAVTLFI